MVMPKVQPAVKPCVGAALTSMKNRVSCGNHQVPVVESSNMPE